jgi:serine/threonine-protein kinase
MRACPDCSAPAIGTARFCAACGASLEPQAAAVATLALPEDRAIPRSSTAPPGPHEEGPAEGRFIPGTMLAGRYRLVALLGRGGMGEVYRADDLRLGQTVALKFLPDAVARDADMLARFFAEVRIGRQVSHPNVVRLYDLIEIEGHPCLAMEFVDGEDLSSLLARIGRLPPAKAVDIARDLCGGLAAAHDKGVIHRDLKPANVMIDGKGRARIADFGIAALAGSVDAGAFAGTPAYLAPELLRGQPATVQSDLFALGLVLYEACTGQRRFNARSLGELKALHETTAPPKLADTARDIPVQLERAVLCCLEMDPAERPSSAHAVMASLPGGDPLQAAMAAGETPSPAMVAAAGTVGDLGVAAAWAWLGAALAGLALLLSIVAQATLIGRIAPPNAPEVLEDRTRTILASLGYADPPADTAGYFESDLDYDRQFAGRDRTRDPWRDLADARPGPLRYVHRQSPRPMAARITVIRGFAPAETGRIVSDDPPFTRPGMIDVQLDPRGRLVDLRVLPVATARTATDAALQPDWSKLFAAAGLEAAQLTPVAAPDLPVATDHVQAWEATFPGQPERVQVEAAMLHGKPVWFRMHRPGLETDVDALPASYRVALWVGLIVSAGLWIALAALVRRNLRLGRGDRAGARRLAVSMFVLLLAAQLLRADHVAVAFEEMSIANDLLAHTLMNAVVLWLTYVGLEPIARRRWPRLLVGWSRLLSGRWRDPMVGRDVLLGVVGGVALVLVLHLAIVVPAWLGAAAPAPRGHVVSSLGSLRHLLYFALLAPYTAVIIGFGTLLGVYLGRVVLRWHALAVMVAGLCLYFGFAVFTGIREVWSVASAVFAAIYLLILMRRGLLAAVAAFAVFMLLDATPFTADPSAWYADRTLLTLALLAGLLGLAFWTSLGGKSPFGNAFADRDEARVPT